MKKYPWTPEEEINWLQPMDKVFDQYMTRYFDLREKFIDYYFKAEIIKMLCITGWLLFAILLTVFLVTK